MCKVPEDAGEKAHLSVLALGQKVNGGVFQRYDASRLALLLDNRAKGN